MYVWAKALTGFQVQVKNMTLPHQFPSILSGLTWPNLTLSIINDNEKHHSKKLRKKLLANTIN